MANHKSAVKEHRQSLKRRQTNRSHRSTLRTQIKIYRTALESGDTDTARGMLSETLSMVDRSARHGAIESNAADRTKSRLTKALNRAAS
jgi:small subunit ribosomal protein S20